MPFSSARTAAAGPHLTQAHVDRTLRVVPDPGPSGRTPLTDEDIAARAGISQPYLFRLFGTKKDLYVASVSRCFRETLELLLPLQADKARAPEAEFARAGLFLARVGAVEEGEGVVLAG